MSIKNVCDRIVSILIEPQKEKTYLGKSLAFAASIIIGIGTASLSYIGAGIWRHYVPREKGNSSPAGVDKAHSVGKETLVEAKVTAAKGGNIGGDEDKLSSSSSSSSHNHEIDEDEESESSLSSSSFSESEEGEGIGEPENAREIYPIANLPQEVKENIFLNLSENDLRAYMVNRAEIESLKSFVRGGLSSNLRIFLSDLKEELRASGEDADKVALNALEAITIPIFDEDQDFNSMMNGIRKVQSDIGLAIGGLDKKTIDQLRKALQNSEARKIIFNLAIIKNDFNSQPLNQLEIIENCLRMNRSDVALKLVDSMPRNAHNLKKANITIATYLLVQNKDLVAFNNIINLLNKNEQNRVYKDAAVIFAKNGDIDKAILYANKIPPRLKTSRFNFNSNFEAAASSIEREEVLLKIVEIIAKKGLIAKAEEIMALMPKGLKSKAMNSEITIKELAQLEIIKGLVENDRLEEGVDPIKKLPKSIQAEARLIIVQIEARKGHIERALQVAQMLPHQPDEMRSNMPTREKAFEVIAIAMAEASDASEEEVLKVCNFIVNNLPKTTSNDRFYRVGQVKAINEVVKTFLTKESFDFEIILKFVDNHKDLKEYKNDINLNFIQGLIDQEKFEFAHNAMEKFKEELSPFHVNYLNHKMVERLLVLNRPADAEIIFKNLERKDQLNIIDRYPHHSIEFFKIMHNVEKGEGESEH